MVVVKIILNSFQSEIVAAQDMRLECSAIKESVRQFNERTTDDADFSAFSFHQGEKISSLVVISSVFNISHGHVK